MKRHSAFGWRFEDNPNVMFRSTRGAYAEVWEVKSNQFIHELQDFFSWWWWWWWNG
jgi:hypothetical protein